MPGLPNEQDQTFILEKVTLDDDQSVVSFAFDEVSVVDEDEAGDEDLNSTLRSIKKAAVEAAKANNEPSKKDSTIERLPEVVDDFVRNYLIRMNMRKTLEAFQTEWYEMVQEGKLKPDEVGTMPDIYLVNQHLEEQAESLRQEIQKWKDVSSKIQEECDKQQKERDFHRIHHKRVGQEKNALLNDYKKLKEKYNGMKPELEEFQNKYEVARKSHVVLQLANERLQKKVDDLEQQNKELLESAATASRRDSTSSLQPATTASTLASTQKTTQRTTNETLGSTGATQGTATLSKTKTKTSKFETPFPAERQNPWLDKTVEPPSRITFFKPMKQFQAHNKGISSLSLHPTKPIFATSSDDFTWKMFTIDDGTLIMSGDGHRSWVSDLDFHPKGTHLVTSSGDNTVKLWDFQQSRCVYTYTDHQQPVWSVAFHDTGDFVVSGSLDKTIKIFDLPAERCRQTLRGHVDSVNQVNFQPYSNLIVSASSDKTVSLWDIRSGQLVKTFVGHKNSCNYAEFNKKGDLILSTDADGIIKVWDVRLVRERFTVDTGDYAANRACFDPSGTIVAVPTEDGLVKIHDIAHNKALVELRDPNARDTPEAVHCAVFTPNGDTLLTAGKDGYVRIWS